MANIHSLFDGYSKTSNSGPSEKWTTSVQQTDHLPPIDFTIAFRTFDTDEPQTYLSQYKTTSEKWTVKLHPPIVLYNQSIDQSIDQSINQSINNQ